MSANTNTTPTSEVSKKVRIPTLTEKYSKFIQFGYYMMSQMSETDSFNRDDFMNQLKVFAPVDEQQAFIQGFFDNQKDVKKKMRKEVQDQKKLNKPKKEKAPRKTKSNDNNKSESNKPTDGDVSQENLIETITNELTEEPMINKINSAIEVAKDLTAKKARVTKNKSTANTNQLNDEPNANTNEIVADLTTKKTITKKKSNTKSDKPVIDDNQLTDAMESLAM